MPELDHKIQFTLGGPAVEKDTQYGPRRERPTLISLTAKVTEMQAAAISSKVYELLGEAALAE